MDDISVEDLEILTSNLESGVTSPVVGEHLFLGFQLPLVELSQANDIDNQFDPFEQIEQWVHTASLFLRLKALIPNQCTLIKLDLQDRPHQSATGEKSALPASTLDPRIALILSSHPLVRRRYSDLSLQADSGWEQAMLELGQLDLYTDAFRRTCWQSLRDSHGIQIQAISNQKELAEAREILAEATEKLAELAQQLDTSEGRVISLREKYKHRQSEIKRHKSEASKLRKDFEDHKNLYVKLREKAKAMRKQIDHLETKAAENLDRLYATQVELEEVFAEKNSILSLCSAQAEVLLRTKTVMDHLVQIRGLPISTAEPSVQVLALLEGYRHSLKRAERLLLGRI